MKNSLCVKSFWSDRFFGIALIIFVIGVIDFATIRDGQDWGDDFAQYLLLVFFLKVA